MSTYVMSNIHGCYDDFISMLAEIKFSDNDQLIIAGNYIDHGAKNFEMLKWLENSPQLYFSNRFYHNSTI